jgi:integrase
MASIEKREREKGTVFKAVVRIKGFPVQRKTFSRITDAKLWVQQTEASIRKGEFQNLVKLAASKTVKNVIERYREEVLPRKADGSQRAERPCLAYWERELGDFALAYVEPEMVSRKLAELRAAGWKATTKKPGDAKTHIRSPRTIKYYRDTLDLLYKYAKRWGWTRTNPLDGVDRITKLNNERVRYLSNKERDKLLTVCKASNNKQLYPIVAFALSTGARKGEILGLTLNDVDLKRGIAVLRHTKNGETRSVPVVNHLRTVLKAHVAKVEEKYEDMPDATTHWLFPSHNGLAPIDIRKPWEEAMEEAGLKDFRFHDLRHSTASYLAMSGATQVEIAAVLGHKTLQMVQRYAHLSDSHVRGLIRNLNNRIF